MEHGLVAWFMPGTSFSCCATRQEFDDSGLDSLPASTSWEDWKEDASSAWDGASTAWDEWWKEEEAEEPTFTPPPMSLKAAAKKMDKADMLIAVGMKEDLYAALNKQTNADHLRWMPFWAVAQSRGLNHATAKRLYEMLDFNGDGIIQKEEVDAVLDTVERMRTWSRFCPTCDFQDSCAHCMSVTTCELCTSKVWCTAHWEAHPARTGGLKNTAAVPLLSPSNLRPPPVRDLRPSGLAPTNRDAKMPGELPTEPAAAPTAAQFAPAHGPRVNALELEQARNVELHREKLAKAKQMKAAREASELSKFEMAQSSMERLRVHQAQVSKEARALDSDPYAARRERVASTASMASITSSNGRAVSPRGSVRFSGDTSANGRPVSPRSARASLNGGNGRPPSPRRHTVGAEPVTGGNGRSRSPRRTTVGGEKPQNLSRKSMAHDTKYSHAESFFLLPSERWV